MSLSTWIASRLRIGAGSSRSARTGAWIAVAGVAIALAVMEFTVAVVGGFRDEIRRKVLGFDPEVAVMPAYDATTNHSEEYLHADSALLARLAAYVPDAQASLALRRPAVVKTDSDFAAVYFSAYDPAAHDFAFERSNVTEGVWPDYSADSTRSQVVLSRPVADALQLAVGSRPMLYFVNDGGAVRARRVSVSGIFESRIAERDQTTAYASLGLLQDVSGLEPGWGTAIELRGIRADSAAIVAEDLQARLIADWQLGASDSLYPVDNVRRSGSVFLNWLDLLDTNVVVIFILMLLVAASTLVAALFILVLEHIPTIGLLRALGACRSLVRRIFIATAMRLVGRGMLIGNILGLGMLLLQQHTHLMPLDAEMYYVDYVPVSINWWLMAAINLGTIAAAWLILILPSRIAAKVDPATTIRYE